MGWLAELGAGGLAVELTHGCIRLGRSPDNDLVLEYDIRVSRRHAEFTCRQGSWWVRDCGSRNGTYINNAPVTEALLHSGDHVLIGSHEFVFTDGSDPLATMADTDEDDASAERPLPKLSSREQEIVALVASGATDLQIARILTIGVSTVRTHLDRIRDKTGRRRRPDLTRLAAELGLTIPQGPSG